MLINNRTRYLYSKYEGNEQKCMAKFYYGGEPKCSSCSQKASNLYHIKNQPHRCSVLCERCKVGQKESIYDVDIEVMWSYKDGELFEYERPWLNISTYNYEEVPKCSLCVGSALHVYKLALYPNPRPDQVSHWNMWGDSIMACEQCKSKILLEDDGAEITERWRVFHTIVDVNHRPNFSFGDSVVLQYRSLLLGLKEGIGDE